jgi:hypothetical protein
MTKIIGFLISKEKKEFDIDVFNVGLNKIEIKYGEYYIYLWGIGNIENYKINGKYSLSFPITDSLYDRNILISFEDGNIIVENDWLGSIPVFYNIKELIVSTLPNLCLRDKTISNEGLANFCEFGYSVFEQTMFEDVKFMRYFSKLIITPNHIKIEYKDDPIHDKAFLTKETTTEEVVAKMKSYISNIESNIDGDIVLPTSGGYDSRMLNYLVENKSKIRSFTYGISKDQSQSIEVVHAKKISEIYKIKWEQIELNEYHRYINEWFSIYGFSTHLHGMYHIEFYSKILKRHSFKNPTLLSGIVGDAWAELGKFKDINTYEDIINLGYTHGINLDPKYLKLNFQDVYKKKFFIQNRTYLKNDKLKPVYVVRTKLVLLSYLTQIPEYFGMPAWTPFLNFDIVKAILNLPDEQRKNRNWQRSFFKSVGLNLEDMHLKSDKINRLDYEVAKNENLEPLDVELLSKFIEKKRLIEINRYLENTSIYENLKNQLLCIPKIGGLLRRLGFKNEFLKALYEYYVVKAIEKGLKYES